MGTIYRNNVRTFLTLAATSSATSLEVTAGVSPFATPPDPSQSGGLCYITLTDNLAVPTRYEVVTYDGVSGSGPFTLTGVRRGQEGTQSESWGVGTTLFQSWTSSPARQIQGTRPNALINPDFRIWQRGVNQLAITTAKYTADKWRLRVVAQGTWDAERVSTRIPDFTSVGSLVTYGARLTAQSPDSAAPGAGDIVALEQYIEGDVYRRYARKEKVATFYVSSNRTGTYGFALQEGVASVSFIQHFTINAPNTVEKKTLRIPAHSLSLADMSSTYGAVMAITLAAGTNFTTAEANRSAWLSGALYAPASIRNGAEHVSSTYTFSAIGLYEGRDPPDFEIPDHITELGRCYRYYQKSFPEDISPGNAAVPTAGVNEYAGVRAAPTDHRVNVRHSPKMLREQATRTLFTTVTNITTAAAAGKWSLFDGAGWNAASARFSSLFTGSTGFEIEMDASAAVGWELIRGEWVVDADYP